MYLPHCICIAGEYEYLPLDGIVGQDETCGLCTYNCKTCTDDSICDTCDVTTIN